MLSQMPMPDHNIACLTNEEAMRYIHVYPEDARLRTRIQKLAKGDTLSIEQQKTIREEIKDLDNEFHRIEDEIEELSSELREIEKQADQLRKKPDGSDDQMTEAVEAIELANISLMAAGAIPNGM